MFQKGQVVRDYIIESDNSKNGRFGFVFIARDSKSNQKVALKVCDPNCTKDEKERFERENSILYKLYPHIRIIAPYCKIFIDESLSWYAMELADSNLSEFLNVNYFALSPKNKLDIFIKICEGLEYAHQKKIVHRDLHWNNVLLTKISTCDEPKLCDFGRAKDFDEKNKNNYSPQRIAGAVHILPPENYFKTWEEARLNEYIYSDLYSLGILLYFIYAINPSPYYAILKSEIDSFLFAKKIGNIASLSVIKRRKLYFEWANQFDLRTIDKYLKLNLIDKDFSDKLNDIIINLCHPNYEKRYKNVRVLLEKLRRI